MAQEKVSQVFNTYISGNVQNVATGSSHVTQSGEFIVVPGDFESLRSHLSSLGIEASDISELDRAIHEDTQVQGKLALGKRVQAWTGKMVGKAASGAWKVSISVAGAVLGKALSKYFDLE